MYVLYNITGNVKPEIQMMTCADRQNLESRYPPESSYVPYTYAPSQSFCQVKIFSVTGGGNH